MDFPQLPDGFLFGASTASYQIEGAVDADGRGPSVWDTFSAGPGVIKDGTTGAVACDHYHRHAEDVALMKRLGLDGYRLSLAWPRIQPTGSGPVNQAGLDFYDRLLDELLAAGVAPMVTLYHWDLPQPLQDAGGWTVRETTERFAEFAAIAAERYADRVAHWCPVNEPNVVMMLGHGTGVHAPGLRLGLGALPVAHHLNLAHGLAVQALRSAGAQQVGAANNHAPIWAASDAEGDVAARDLMDVLWNGLFADPMLLGRYPEGFGEAMPVPAGRSLEDDLAVIAQPLDFYGVNHYNPTLVGAAAEGDEPPVDLREIEGYATTDFDWPVVPDGMREILIDLKDRYPDLPPVIVTENGASYAVGPDADGVVDDQARIDYLDSYLRAIGQAIDEGVEVAGFYTWSLLDNWEWAEGFTQRFGLVYVDYGTQQRIPKRSFDWYAGLIRAHHRP